MYASDMSLVSRPRLTVAGDFLKFFRVPLVFIATRIYLKNRKFCRKAGGILQIIFRPNGCSS